MATEKMNEVKSEKGQFQEMETTKHGKTFHELLKGSLTKVDFQPSIQND